MATFLEQGKKSIAEKWQAKIDRPKYGINKNAVKQMDENTVAVIESFGSYIYIFDDGSSLWEKRRDDWYTDDNYLQCKECNGWFSEQYEDNNDCEHCYH
jgi:hypothetical protein